MDYTCKNCGNIFGDHLTVCPNCGAAVEAAPVETKAVDAEPEVQAAQPEVQAAQPEVQQQAYQQQAYQQQPYQQQPYQQQAYQQQPYQQQPYQQQPYQQQYYNPNMAMSQPKSKMAAGLLGLFLGAWGVHNFYLGFTSKAVIQIVVTICTCGLGGLWGFIEGIMILAGSINTDANGRPLTE